MKNDNVLVSREKWEAMESFITDLHNAHIEWDLFDPLTMGRDINERLKEIFAMPDFIESERDVELVARNLHASMKIKSIMTNGFCSKTYIQPYDEVSDGYTDAAELAINALRIKGE